MAGCMAVKGLPHHTHTHTHTYVRTHTYYILYHHTVAGAHYWWCDSYCDTPNLPHFPHLITLHASLETSETVDLTMKHTRHHWCQWAGKMSLAGYVITSNECIRQVVVINILCATSQWLVDMSMCQYLLQIRTTSNVGCWMVMKKRRGYTPVPCHIPVSMATMFD